MKFPKSKTGLFIVGRYLIGAEDGTPVGCFVTAEGADNYAGACEQRLKDVGITAYTFRVSYVMFYNE